MPHSLPSKEAYLLDIPEIKKFQVGFQYNYFVPDEQTSESSGIPESILFKSTEHGTAENAQYLKTRFPRFIKFDWEKPTIPSSGNEVLGSDLRKNSLKASTKKSLIKENYRKIISEDYFSFQNFINVTFHDGEIDNKIFNLISGTYEQLQLTNPIPLSSNHKQASFFANNLLPDVDPHFIFRGLSQPNISQGTFFFGKDSINKSVNEKKVIGNSFLERLKKVYINTQINSKLFSDITNRVIQDPQASHDVDIHSLQNNSKNLKSIKNFNISLSESDFKTFVPYIDFKIIKTSFQNQRSSAEIVGYVIDKYEVLDDGSLKTLAPIIIESANVNNAFDPLVKYNQNYCYSIRTIALYTLPAIDDDTNQIALVQMLVSSKPTNKFYAKIHDDTAPPPPADINFVWNYEKERLMVHWSFPVNPQRDIKKFQVFRRKSTNEPFELLKQYDFDDSYVKSKIEEKPFNKVVEYLDNPVTFYIDDDFKKDSSYIYTLCSIDAHGLTSCYAPQYQLGFDIFKNQLTKKLVSHSGAPKQYPNLYLEGSGFVDSANVKGSFTKRMFLYFTPQFYQIEDEHQRAHRIISTNQNNGSYKFQFINVDNQKSETLTVKIDDRIRATKPKLSFPTFRFNIPTIKEW
jgi:hypothetical protein